jgi:hypothetical protein
MLYIGEIGRPLRTKFGEHWRAVIGDVSVFQIWKFEPSVPFLVATIAAKDTKCISFPNLALFGCPPLWH